jgi:hypothetical protein
MKPLILTLLFSSFAYASFAQFSAIQNAAGESSYQLFTSNTIAVNASNASVGFSIKPRLLSNDKRILWNITGSTAARDGISPLFKGGSMQFNGRLGANIIRDITYYPKATDPPRATLKYVFAGAEVIYDHFNVYDSTKAIDDRVYDRSSTGFRVNLGINVLAKVIFGASVSAGMKSNTDLLEQLTVSTVSSVVANGPGLQSVSTSDDAYDKRDLTVNKAFGRVNVDLAKQLFNTRLLVNLHFSGAYDENYKPEFNPALGVFLTCNGAPLEALVGIQLQTKDWFNNRSSEKSRWERSALVLTAGFPF